MKYKILNISTLIICFFNLSVVWGQLPTTYDLRNVNGNNYVTSVKNQQGGTCWTHGTMAAIEGNMLMTGEWTDEGETGEPNLAEYHLDWWNGYNQFYNEDLTPPTGNGLEVHMGGDYMVSTAYLSRLEGSVRDIDAQSYNTAPDRNSEAYHKYYSRTVEWLTMDVNLNGIDEIKTKIIENGVLATCMCYDGAFISNYIHYQPPTSTLLPNHSVSIIGWDDNKDTQATLNGAWLVKNSWGTSWGNAGYFWISYYDKWACKEPDMGAVSFSEVELNQYNHVYYHDYHGWRDNMPNITEAFNAFTSLENEVLSAVSFFINSNDVTYTVKIFDTFDGSTLSDELTTVTGILENRGFHTINLPTPISLVSENDFYIYLSLSEGGMPYDRTSDVPVLLGGGSKTIVNSTANSGESYYNESGTWKDFYDYNDPSGFQHTGNFCIKGLTKAAYSIKMHINGIDDQMGNNNGVIDPGETVDISVSISNEGSYVANDVNVIYSSTDSYLVINTPNINFGNIGIGEQATGLINVTIGNNAPVGHIVDGILDVNYISNNINLEKEFDLNLEIGQIVEDFESGNFDSFDWQISGNSPWYVTNTESYEGSYSTRSGIIGNSQNSILEINVDVLNDGFLSFYKKVSSEPDYDFLKFYINGLLLDEWSGEVDWSLSTYPMTVGNHTLKWVYFKDVSMAEGSDCAWLDYIKFPGIDNSMSVEENIDTSFNLFPNPADNFIKIDGINSVEEIQIFDQKGLNIKRVKNLNNNIYEVEDLKQGVYFVRILYNKENYQIIKLIIK